VNDYGAAARRVQRVTLAGDVPMSLGGRESVAIRGDSSAYVS
jgi:hypothetical protein